MICKEGLYRRIVAPGRWAEAGRIVAVLLVALVVFVAGCREDVYHGLTERQANQLVVALEQEGIPADKRRDSSGENKWVVTVPGGQKVRAWKVLESRGLPKPAVKGFGEFYPTGGLIPTSSEERVLYQYAKAQELRKTLLAVDGVVEAQVNLVLPEKPRVKLSNQTVEPPRASVLVKYTANAGASEKGAPVTEAEVREIVAGGVERLEPKRVRVLIKPARAVSADLEEPDLTSVGPVAVAPQSKTILQAVIGLMGFIVVALGGCVVYLLWQRMSEAEDER